MIVETLQKLKFEYSSLVAREPILIPLYIPVIWWQQYKIWQFYSDAGAARHECIVGSHTEFIIDGFQGSANSYAADAFKQSQRASVAMAHHMHSPVQIIRGVKMGLPTLVTIRDPTGSVLSLASRWPYVSVQQALRGYVGFYSKLEPYMEGYVISPFEVTTSHLDIAINTVNDRFGTNFDVLDQPREEMSERHGPPTQESEEKIQRDKLKIEKGNELRNPRCQKLLRKAEDLHERFVRFGIKIPNRVSR